MHNFHFAHDLLLVGGGHSHVLVLKQLAMRPLQGVRVTLVSDLYEAPYSGMLPGFVAGHYSADQTRIDLNGLCKKVGARWIQGRVIGIRPDENCVEIENQPELFYDCLSIDTGAQPDFDKGRNQANISKVKPIAQFHQQWQGLLETLNVETTAKNIGVVGAGVGGVELSLAMAHRLGNVAPVTIHLMYRGASILPGLPRKAVHITEQKLLEFGVRLHPEFDLVDAGVDYLRCASGEQLNLDHSFICTPVVAPNWLSKTGLALSPQGFVAVNKFLQSCSHRNVFAAGDVADIEDLQRPKAGVYAVRQAPFLAQNLHRFFAQTELKPVRLQTDFLKLVSLGEKSALAIKYGLVFKGRLLWRWKNSIDQKFMNQFGDITLAAMPETTGETAMHCSGCGSKLGPQLLHENLAQIPANKKTSLSSAVHTVEDATVWQPSSGKQVAQSIDGFRSFTQDHYRFGKISVQHALNDLFAMGAEPICAQAWANLAFSHRRLQQRDHLRMMQGVNSALLENDAVLAGGHSSEGVEDHLGIVVNGELPVGHHWPKASAQLGDVLLMSKALGTGIVLAADAECGAPPKTVQAAMAQMQSSNRPVFQALKKFTANAVTDISGFGLLGHLLEMLEQEGLAAEIQLSRVAFLDGALALAEQGFQSSLRPSVEHYLQYCSFSDKLNKARLELLLDPQTSGGLLAAVPADQAERLILHCPSLSNIGRITRRSDAEQPITLL